MAAIMNMLLGSSGRKRIGWIISIALHVLLILAILYIPRFIREPEEEAYEGILVSFGLPVESSGDEVGKIIEQQEEEIIEQAEKITEENKEEQFIETELEDEQSEIVLEKSSSEKKVNREKKVIVEEKEDSPEEKMDKAKSEFGKLFSSKGNSNQRMGDQGDPLGEPDAEMLEGISKGRGKVGGGLDERGVLHEPEIVEHSQKSGKVVIKVCVDKTGKVISSHFTQKGSTTTDSDLVEIAELSAYKYRFTPSEFEEQCGTISINFIVK